MHLAGNAEVPIFKSAGGWRRIAKTCGAGTAQIAIVAAGCFITFEISWAGDAWDIKVLNSLGDLLKDFSVSISAGEAVLEAYLPAGDCGLAADYVLASVPETQPLPQFVLQAVEIDGPTGDVKQFDGYMIATPDNTGGPFLATAGGHMTGGINFGGAVAGDPNDTSKHITFAPTDSTNAGDLSKGVYLYQGNDYLGIGVSSSTMNFVCRNAGDKFDFWTGGVLHTRVDNTGLVVPEGQKLTIAGQDSDERYALKSEIPVIPPPTEAIDAYTKAESDAKYQQLPDNALTQAVADTLYMPIGYVPPVGEVPSSATVGDIKAGFQTADHAGWVILDGRAITALTAIQQTAATSLGFTANLPDALNAVPLQNMGVMGTVSGSTSITLTEAQMPSHHHEAVACTNDEGTVGFSELLTGDNFPATICWRRPATIANQNNHNLEMSGRMMLDVGSGAPIDITPKSMAVNQFVYLGA